ncbi:zinc-binding dehydrogenase [uncultured Limosilactobacillus sp.]|uniref:zinc-binding dehydrogenase n=1 Tax=uncultured Limosilactobacillus sp. TaxID=2837629 RepID=UPI00263675DD|nr:zinc-binding dehydrogenase [uncultured Limosilactobacillus sp.]
MIVDISDEKLQAVKDAGADMIITSAKVDPAKEVQDKIGGAQAAVVTATATICYDQALASVRAGGKVVAISLPKGNIDVPIAKTVLDGIEIVGSLVGTRQDLAEAFKLTAEGAINPIVHTRKLSEINNIVDEMKNGKIVGRMVVDFTNGAN